MSKVAPYLQSNWDWRAAINFIGGGTGAGLIFAAAWGWLSGMPFWLLGGVALICVGIGLLSVWAEIGKPLRALHVFFHPATSWMTREAIVAMPLGFFTLISMASDAGFLFQDGGAATIVIATVIALIYLYCQARILREAKGIPAWRHRSLMPLMGVSGLAEGFGLAALIALALNHQSPWIAYFLIALPIMRGVGWWNYLFELKKGNAPKKAIDALSAITVLTQIFANGVPFILAVASLLLPDMSLPINALCGLILLLGGWHMKFVIITKASFNQGFAIPQMPIRGKGKVKGAAKPGWE